MNVGLGIVFDTSPGTPLHMRSDAQDWGGKMHTGAAVVSGILDDGTGYWVDTKVEAEIGSTGVPEAAYLSAAAGACEAAFRNADGVLFARISHANSSIKVAAFSLVNLCMDIDFLTLRWSWTSLRILLLPNPPAITLILAS